MTGDILDAYLCVYVSDVAYILGVTAVTDVTDVKAVADMKGGK